MFTTDSSKAKRHQADILQSSRSRSLLRMTLRKNCNVAEDDKRAESKSRLILHMVNRAPIKKGDKIYRGFDDSA